MRTHVLLDDAWIERFNADIRGEPRQVVALPDTRMRIRLTDAPTRAHRTVELDVDDGLPRLRAGSHGGLGSDAVVTADVEMPYDLFRSMVVDGDMLAGMRAFDDGGIVATGRRETLLYFLYHLFPDGPEGAARVSSTVATYTA